MKAVEFVKKFGWGKACKVLGLTKGNSWADHYNIKDDAIGTAGSRYSKILCERNDDFVCLHDLKTLVEAKTLVDLYGGLSDAKLKSEIPMCFGDNDFFQEVTLKKAIKLVESVEK